MTTVLFSHPSCLDHDPGDGHPEAAGRIRAITDRLEHEEFLYLLRDEAPAATQEQLLRAHAPGYLDQLRALAPPSGMAIDLDGDTVMSAGSWRAGLHAAGAVCAAVADVAAGRSGNAFCLTRPPGHHAGRSSAGGFCLLSNAAIGALEARALGFQRVAVVDFDVHHGNGTQDILWGEPGTFYASSHQADAFPFTGFAEETGPSEDGAVIVNVPLPAGTRSEAFRAAYTDIILPRLHAFNPDFLIVSAGFDGHAADPMAHFRLTVGDFEWVTRALLAAANERASGRLVSVLEGGYEPQALAASVAAHVRALMVGG